MVTESSENQRVNVILTIYYQSSIILKLFCYALCYSLMENGDLLCCCETKVFLTLSFTL